MRHIDTLHLQKSFLVELSEFIGKTLGLYFPAEKWTELERGFFEIMRHFQYSNAKQCLEELKKTPLTQTQIEILASCLTIGETYFFREPASFEALEKTILPELIEAKRKRGNKTIRIWSAACSTGEEAYTIAILLKKLLQDLSEWNITVLATDINPYALKKVLNGIYGEWSFRVTDLETKKKYFNLLEKNKYEILPSLKRMVTVAHLNLAEDSYPSLLNNTTAMDIIFCKNLLMYFVPEQINQTLHHLYHSLSDMGTLAVSAAEHSLLPRGLFKTVNFPETIFYKKPTGSNQAIFQENPIQDIEKRLKESEEIIFLQPKNEAILDLPTENRKDLIETPQAETETMESLKFNARSLADQGKLDKALLLIEHAIATDSCNSELHFLKSLIHQEQGAAEESILELKKVIYLDPNFILAYYILGNLARNHGRQQESKKYYSIVLSLLETHLPQTVIPCSEGITVLRMREIIQSFEP